MNSGIFYVPDSHPTPSASSGMVSGFLIWSVFGRCCFVVVGGAARFCCLACSTYNACITRYGGSEARHLTPPNKIIMTIVFKNSRLLGVGRQEKVTPIEILPGAVHSSPLPSAALQSAGRKGKWGSGKRTVTQMCWTSGWLKTKLSFWCSLHPYLLEIQSSITSTS